MKIFTKHPATQGQIVRKDFSGGLNTAISVDGIAENQLSEVMNMEIDHSTGQLKTVGGTKDILHIDTGDLFAVVVDSINNKMLIVKDNKEVCLSTSLDEPLGKLSGQLYPVYTAWEDGVLIASGGKLQYYNGKTLSTIDSPKANSVFIRAGRVLITDDTQIRYSGIGDENNWTDDSADASASKFVEAGYKDGGSFVGMVSLSSDILLIKDNRRVYRLSGEYPDWVMQEVSRQVECKNRLAFCAVADAVYVLGSNEFQVFQTTDQYGDVKPSNVAALVSREIQKLPADVKVKYIPALNQIWIIGNVGYVLIFDNASNAWFIRHFNSHVIDVWSVGDTTYIAKKDRVSVIDETVFYDNGLPLMWKFKAQRLISNHEYLLKRTQIAIAARTTDLYSGSINVGAAIIPLPLPAYRIRIWQNRSRIYKNRLKIMVSARNKGHYMQGDLVYNNINYVYGNTAKIFNTPSIIKESRNVFRSRFLDIGGSGSGGGFVLNSITMDIAEV